MNHASLLDVLNKVNVTDADAVGIVTGVEGKGIILVFRIAGCDCKVNGIDDGEKLFHQKRFGQVIVTVQMKKTIQKMVNCVRKNDDRRVEVLRCPANIAHKGQAFFGMLRDIQQDHLKEIFFQKFIGFVNICRIGKGCITADFLPVV